MKNVIENTVLSENYTFFVGDAGGRVAGGEHGLYNRDTRFLSHYEWRLPGQTQTLSVHSPRPDTLELHHAELDHHRQVAAVKRQLAIGDGWLSDRLTLENPLLDAKVLRLELSLDNDFADLFEVRGWPKRSRSAAKHVEDGRVRFTYTTADDLELAVEVSFSEPFEVEGEALVFRLELPPKSERSLEVNIHTNNPLETGAMNPVSYDAWREQFADLEMTHPPDAGVLARAVNDLRALLLFNEAGTIPAAGIPWFAAAFGRDSLLTAHMLLPRAPEVAEGTLRYLARHQATETDDFRVAQPGKIMHELRAGELTRTGEVPFGPYYGTVDATPLFVMVLGKLYETNKDLDFVRELRPCWEAALTWLTNYGDADGDGFLEFTGASRDQGLFFQSWKDSEDSVSHADGTLAWGKLAVCEVQGYAYAAYRAAAGFYRDLGETKQAQTWQERASRLKRRFHEAFWLEDLQTYAMALDSEKRPLEVHSSGAGHLLWTGIVPEETAPALIKSLMGPETWTGWGVRTLGKSAGRYNPVSYHNGSVWPHDTALVAGGLRRYGFQADALRIARAMFDLSTSQPDLRPPELVAGYARTDAPPIPYPTACRPQAWSSAALVYLADLLE